MPTSPPALDVPAHDIPALRAHIDATDAAILDLVKTRLALASEIASLRAAEGGPRLSLAREQEIIARFTSALGPDGSSLALLLLRLSRGAL